MATCSTVWLATSRAAKIRSSASPPAAPRTRSTKRPNDTIGLVPGVRYPNSHMFPVSVAFELPAPHHPKKKWSGEGSQGLSFILRTPTTDAQGSLHYLIDAPVSQHKPGGKESA